MDIVSIENAVITILICTIIIGVWKINMMQSPRKKIRQDTPLPNTAAPAAEASPLSQAQWLSQIKEKLQVREQEQILLVAFPNTIRRFLPRLVAECRECLRLLTLPEEARF